jgi:MFS family permease
MSLAMRLKPWHRRNAALLLVFLGLHLTSHVSALFGPETQSILFQYLRPLYRAPFIEPILIGLFLTQVGLGLILVAPRLRQSQKPLWSWIQITSGLYLALFIVNHIFLGILRGRTYAGVETGFYFVASTLVTAPIRYGFIPYYSLAVIALFVHIAAALHWSGRSKRVSFGVLAIGAAVAFITVGYYAGLFYAIELPEAYQRYIEDAF